MVHARKVLALFPVIGALALAACSSGNESALEVAVVQGAPGEEGSEELTGLSARLARAATVEGLVAFDEQGRVIPALADRWIVTDDGLSYIFRLRDGNWANGDELTAATARKSIDYALKALRGTPMALDLADIDEVRVMAGRVIEIRLFRPMPYLLQLLAQPEMGLFHDNRGAGPMTMRREGADTLRLTPMEPSTLGLPEVKNWATRTREVGLSVVPGPQAVKQFNDGKVDLVLGGRIEDFLLTRSVGILRGTIQLDPVVGLFGLQVMNDEGFLAEPSNREALAMAIDREALIDPFGVGGWQPTTRLVTPSLDGDLGTIGERWGGQSLEQRREVAAGRVRGWMARNGTSTENKPASAEGAAPRRAARGGAAQAAPVLGRAPRLSVWLPEGEGSQILYARLSADLAAISVRLERTEEREDADLVLVDDVARYPRAAWYLHHLSCADRPGLCSPEADARVAEADMAQSPQERAALLTEAEAELTGANVFIPFGTPIRWSLVRGSVSGFATNSWGWHPLMPLSWLPK